MVISTITTNRVRDYSVTALSFTALQWLSHDSLHEILPRYPLTAKIIHKAAFKLAFKK
jgi:hypothetical protein